jgi:ABC-type branched-subunit amino acid transport system ATPase component
MKEKNKFDVVFTEDRKYFDNFTLENTILIKPVSRGWNDFGHKIQCEFLISLSGKKPIKGDMLIGFLPDKECSDIEKEKFEEKRDSLFDYFKKFNESYVESKFLPFYFTLLPNLKGYRYLVENLKPKDLECFLLSVNDLVFYKETENDWFNRAVDTEVFKIGFMRNSEPFFAYNNADNILNGIEEKFSGISKSLDLSFKIQGFQVPHELKLRYSNKGLVPRRINILIGKNGLGKSQALKNFCRSALRYEDEGLDLIDVESSHKRPMISRILAIATPGETANTFPKERRSTQKLFYRRLDLSRDSSQKTSRSVSESLVQLARSEEYIGENDRWDLFLGAIKKSLPIDSIYIALKNDKYVSLENFARGNEQVLLERWGNVNPDIEPKIRISDKTYPLSSGQLTFLKFALLCCIYIENGSFVLMDEPETHLHPNLISEFVELLDYLLELTGSQALLATHSAYFVREVPREQVHVFQQFDNGIIMIDKPRLKTFGATVDSISHFVFGEDAEIALIKKIYKKVKNKKFKEVQDELSDHLSLSALMNLRRMMEEKE